MPFELLLSHSGSLSNRFQRVNEQTPVGGVQKHLVSVLKHARTFFGTPASANFPAPTSSYELDFQHIYAPMLRQAADKGINDAAAANPGAPIVSQGGGIRSILNSSGTWDLAPGATARMSWRSNSPAYADGKSYFLSLIPVDRVGSRVETRDYEYPIPRERGVVGAALFFSHMRGEITKVEVLPRRSARSALQGATAQPLVEGDRWTWDVQWGRRLGAARKVHLRVSFSGDPPNVRAVTFLVTKGTPLGTVTFAKGTLPTAPERPVPLESRANLSDYSYDYAAALKYRRTMIAPGDSEGLFFLELEERTHPRAPGATSFSAFNAFLASSFWARADRHHVKSSTKLRRSEIDSWKSDAEGAGKVIEDLLIAHFSDSRGLNIARVTRAFDRFASGALAVFDNHGVPDGANIFCFAELAMVLRTLGYNSRLWGRLLEAFGHACEIYVHAYHDGSSRRFSSYAVRNGPKRLTPSKRSKIAANWSSRANAEKRYDELVHAALYDELATPGTHGRTAVQFAKPVKL